MNVELYRDRELDWASQRFVRVPVRCVEHVPTDLAAQLRGVSGSIERVGAAPRRALMFTESTEPDRGYLYVHVTKDVRDLPMVALSGRFLTRVYEGPFSERSIWLEDMHSRAAARGAQVERVFISYANCPACAGFYGRNQALMFAKLR